MQFMKSVILSANRMIRTSGEMTKGMSLMPMVNNTELELHIVYSIF